MVKIQKPDMLSTGNGQVQRVKVEQSTRHKWVKQKGYPDDVLLISLSRPRWFSWMRRPTGDQEVAGSTPAEVGNILSWRLIMKYFLRSFSPFR